MSHPVDPAFLALPLRARADVETRVHAFGAPRSEALTSSYADLTELAEASSSAAPTYG